MLDKKIIKSKANFPANSQTTADFDKMIRVILFNSMAYFYFYFLLSYVPVQYFNASGPQIGIIFSSSIIGRLVSSLVIGFLSDKFRNQKKLFVCIGSIGRGICYLLIYIAINIKSLEFFIVAIFFQGCMVLVFWTPLDMLISEKSNKNYRTIALARKTKLIGIGSLIGTLITFGILWFFTRFFPQNVWIFYSPLMIFAFFNIFSGIKFYRNVNDDVKEIIVLSEKKDHDKENDQINDKKILIGFILLLTVTLMVSINNNFANPFLQAYLIENIVQDPMLIMIISSPAIIFGYMFAPKLGRLTLRVNNYLMIILICVFGALSTWMVISTRSGIIFSGVLLFDSLFITTENLIIQTYTSKLSTKHRGKIYSAMYLAQYVGAIAAPLMGGFIWENIGHKAPFQITIIVEILLIIPYLLAIYFLNPRINEDIIIIEENLDKNLKIEKTISVSSMKR